MMYNVCKFQFVSLLRSRDTAVGRGRVVSRRDVFCILKLMRMKVVKMTDFEHRVVIKLVVKLNKSDVEIRKMLEEAYGESTSKKTCVNKWAQRFREGRQSLQDDERIGRPLTSTAHEKIEVVERLINTDRRLTVAEVAAECDISFGSAQIHFNREAPNETRIGQIGSSSFDCGTKRTAHDRSY